MDSKKKILIIEADHDIRAVYAELLKQAGYDVIESNNEIDSRIYTNQGDWDLLIVESESDMLCDSKKCESLKDKPFIVLTNLGKDINIKLENGLSPNGCLDYLDSSPREVLELVNSILN